MSLTAAVPNRFASADSNSAWSEARSLHRKVCIAYVDDDGTICHLYRVTASEGGPSLATGCSCTLRSEYDAVARRQRAGSRRMLGQVWNSRRAYRYLIAATATIAVVDSDRTSAAATARVAVIMRLPQLLRSGLEQRTAAISAASMNSYLESLVIRDLTAPADRVFEVFVETTCHARGSRGGRPAKGPRSVILLRVDPAVRQLIHSRAAALELRVNVYFESLVSQDISAAASAREEMAFDQTA